jgi:Tfp pilus assembly protein PilF
MDQIGKSPSARAELRVKELLRTTGLHREELSRTVAGNLMRAGRLPAALEVLEAHAGSSEPETLLLRGEIEARLGRDADARASFDRVLARHPGSAAARRNVGILLLGQGRPAEARPWLEKAVALDAGEAAAWNGLGVIRARAGDTEGAVAAWRRAVQADPRLADAWYNLGTTLARRGERAAAREAVERYAALADGAERRRALALLGRLGR